MNFMNFMNFDEDRSDIFTEEEEEEGEKLANGIIDIIGDKANSTKIRVDVLIRVIMITLGCEFELSDAEGEKLASKVYDVLTSFLKDFKREDYFRRRLSRKERNDSTV